MLDERVTSTLVSAPGATQQPLTRPQSLIFMLCTVGAERALVEALAPVRGDVNAAFIAFPDVRAGFCNLLRDRLQPQTQLPLHVLSGEHYILPGHAYLVPSQLGLQWASPGQDQPVTATGQDISPSAPEITTRIRISIEKAIDHFGGSITALVFSGMGGDSLEALRQVKLAGGKILAQSESTSLVHQAPRAVIEAGLADEVMPLWTIGGHLAEVTAK